tara:strand:- start:1836 stop:3563 length:1728 start_codon:yes stop_codon:yes gene_type:complete
MDVFKNFWSFLDNKRKFFFFVIIFFSIIQTIFEMIGIAAAIPFVTYLLKPEALEDISFISNYFDLSNISFDENLMIIFCLIFFSIFLLKNFVIIFTNKISYNFIFSFRTNLFSNLLQKILHQEFLFFVQKGISKIFNTTFNEVNIFSVNIVRPLIIMLTEILVSFGILFLIIITGNSNGLILIFPVMVVVGLILKNLNRSIKNWASIRIENNEKIINYNLNLINGIKEILIFGKIKKILEQFNDSLKSLENVDVKNGVVTSYPKVLLEQSVILIFIVIILLMSRIGETNDNIIVILSFYLAAAYRLVPSINKIFVSYQQIKFGKPSIPKIMEYYDLKKANKFFENYETNNSLEFENKIILKNISFSYKNDKNIFKDLNLEISKNKIIGIVGESGSGKSTIVNLLTGLIKAQNGNIIIDEKEINDPLNLRRYQNLFSITSQDTYLIDGSIKDNVIFGSNEKISNDRINSSIKFARLDTTINDLSDGIDTYVGSNIKQLSSGQKQRISIARSIYSDRKILIFDEATNALDKENEKYIFENLKNLKAKKTIIIISHDPDNLKICDYILRVENKNLVSD